MPAVDRLTYSNSEGGYYIITTSPCTIQPEVPPDGIPTKFLPPGTISFLGWAQYRNGLAPAAYRIFLLKYRNKFPGTPGGAGVVIVESHPDYGGFGTGELTGIPTVDFNSPTSLRLNFYRVLRFAK